MVTFSLGTNSKRAANGSTARRIVMQMVAEGLPGPAAGRWHARRGKLCHSPLSPLNSINGKSHVSLRRRKQVKIPPEGWRWPRGRHLGSAGTRGDTASGARGLWLGWALARNAPAQGTRSHRQLDTRRHQKAIFISEPLYVRRPKSRFPL